MLKKLKDRLKKVATIAVLAAAVVLSVMWIVGFTWYSWIVGIIFALIYIWAGFLLADAFFWVGGGTTAITVFSLFWLIIIKLGIAQWITQLAGQYFVLAVLILAGVSILLAFVAFNKVKTIYGMTIFIILSFYAARWLFGLITK